MWQKYIDGQYRQPSGIVGRWIGNKMAQQHQPENAWTVNLLNVQPTDRVLELGFGPGIAAQAVIRRAAFVAGVDFSRTMVAAARKRNLAAILAGRADLRYGDAAELPFAANSFDRVFSIHSIYFWPDPSKALAEAYRVLNPNGTIILTVLPKEKWNPSDPDKAGTPECKPYSGDELKHMLWDAGFTDLRVEADPNPNVPSNFSVIGRKSPPNNDQPD